jgi:hypothetical protein
MKHRMQRVATGAKATRPSVNLGETVDLIEGHASEAEDRARLADVLRDIKAVCKTPRETKVVDALSQLPNPHEAAEALGLSIRQIGDVSNRLYRRYCDRLSARGEAVSLGKKVRKRRSKAQLAAASGDAVTLPPVLPDAMGAELELSLGV